jgi:hypothetical protein
MQFDSVEIKYYEKIKIFNTIKTKSYFIKDYENIPITNQMKNNNCVGHAIAFLINYHININTYVKHNIESNQYDTITRFGKKTKRYLVSANCIYYFARNNDDTKINDYSDIGTKIYYGLEYIKSNLVLEKDWSNYKQIEKPLLYESFTKFNINLSYGKNFYSVPKNLKIIKNNLNLNRPIIVGININDKIFNLKFGQILKCPKLLTEIIGAHAIVLIGYIHELNCFVARNSFGIKYCAQGYFLISYNYIISSFTYDLFILDLITN